VTAELAPDYFEPVVGWRVWLVARQHDALRLRSVAFRTVWDPRAHLVARCEGSSLIARLRRRKTHDAPRGDCGCGIHAAKHLGFAGGYLSTYDDVLAPVIVHRVIGRVSLWGSVVEGEFGWRGSYAYPEHLFVPPRLMRGPMVDADAIAAGLSPYGVPVEVLDEDEHDEIVGALAEAGQWRSRPRRRGRLVW
jgi:hypothetical protein